MSPPSPRPTLPITRFFAHSPFFPAPWVPGIPLAFLLLPLTQALGAVGPAVAFLYEISILASLLACLIPSRIVIGPDGIAHRWLFWERFFPMRDVRALQRTFAIPARLVLRDGRKAFLPFTFSPRNDLMGERSK